jgi:outer membrane protein assembly factor BamB
VVGAVGYHYEQWAQVSAYAQGIGVRTRDNPDFTMLDDETLRPRWSVQVTTKRSAYDASAKRYLVATMPKDSPPDVVALDAGSGRRIWCASLEQKVRESDPFATQFLDDQDVAVLGPAEGSRERIVRLSARDGELVWERALDADSGDFLGDMGDGTLLAGGRAQYELFDPASRDKRPEGVGLVLLSARDGSTIWTRREPAGSDVHVLGTDPATGIAVVQEWDGRAGTALLRAVNREGNQEWFAVPAQGDNFDATLRSGRVLVRVGNRWSAYDIENGRRLWTRTVPAQPQFLPYGFELDSIPLLDADHVLIGGTTALHTLDLRTGAMTSAPLPTDGINTTYWPYQLAVSERLIALATNTGAVVVRRE